MLYPIIINDGTSFHAPYEVEKWLEDVGFNIEELAKVLDEYIYAKSDIDSMCAKADEYEMVADGYCQHLKGLISEVDALVNKLRSGRSGKGYTKLDIADALERACDDYDM